MSLHKVISFLDALALSKQDQRHFDEADKKFQLVKDFTCSVATGRATGFYLYGPGGCGKSHTVLGELERLGVPYKLYNSRMTGRGLYDVLERFPDSIHVMEDIEQLFRDIAARGVLRSALWSQSQSRDEGPMERLITWTTNQMEHSFVFTGGLMMMGNRPFPDVPELHAVKIRTAYMQLTVSDNEIIAMMRKISLAGFRSGPDDIEACECWEVCDHVVAECLGLNRPLDIRLFINSLGDYAPWRECQSRCHWKDLVSSRVKERPTRIGETKSAVDRSKQKADELQLAAELRDNVEGCQERFQIWYEKTGKSQATLYRRFDQLKEA